MSDSVIRMKECCSYSSLPYSIREQVDKLQGEGDSMIIDPQFSDRRYYGESYRELSIFPHPGEVLQRSRVPLRSLVQTGAYPSADMFLDVHFKLLREDMIRPIRDGISLFWNDDSKFRKEMYVYSHVRLLETRCDKRKGILYEVSFLPQGVRDISTIRWNRSKRLIYGTLLCIFPMDSVPGEDVSVYDPLWAVVVNKDDRKLLDICRRFDPNNRNTHYPNITIQFNNGLEPLFSFEKQYYMLESRKVYFEAYKHTLTVLQNMSPSSLPFQNILLGYSQTANIPRYLTDQPSYVMSEIFPNLRGHTMNILRDWPTRSPILDESQYRAVKLALMNEVALIQGPPGTGKTYVGTHVMKILLNTRRQLSSTSRYSRFRNYSNNSNILCCKPIVVITYTNHALDQFLVSLLEFKSEIVRIGNRSEDERIQELTLFKKTDPRCGTLSKVEKIYLTSEMERICSRIRYYSRSLASVYLTEKQIKWYTTSTQYASLTQHPRYTISDWYNCVDLGGNSRLLPPIRAPTELLSIVPPDETDSICDVYSDSENEDAVDFEEDFVGYVSDDEFLSRYDIREDYGKQTTVDMHQCENLWDLPKRERHKLIDNWNKVNKSNLTDRIETLQAEYTELRDVLNEHYEQIDYSAVSRAAVVGMTTTGAAKYSKLFSQLQPHILFIEEAAEVLEAHVVASLSEQVQHLILIGDHQQLRPSFAEFSLKKHHLDQSLFERLIKNDFEHVQLKCQHRMRPEISQLVKHIYPDLRDHHSVLRFNRVLGVKHNLYFLDHTINENNLDKEGLSKSHSHEAKFIAQFASYLLKQGYSVSEISILTFYEAQKYNIKDELMKISKDYNKIRVSTVDRYQGEENKIILFSIVRSNQENNIGHCRVDNRVCVALSRAKEGLFIVGNSHCLRAGGKKTGLWDKILDTFADQLGNTLPLQCQNHPVKLTNVSRAEDFRYVEEGGCHLPCDQVKPCGHKCTLKCHPYSHDEIPCKELCDRVKECGHMCFFSDGKTRKECFEVCGECNVKLRKTLEECEHEMILPCPTQPFHELCKERCEKTLACGHNCRGRCGENCSEVKCLRPCERQHPCGHPCVKEDGETIRKCYQYCDRCYFRVAKTLEECGHVQTLQCYTPPTHSLCTEPCSKMLSCGHTCIRLCGDDCSKFPCSKPCKKLLPCTHTCTNPCNTPCTDMCLVPCEKVKPCNHPCVAMDGVTPKPCYELCGDCNYIVEKEVPNCKHIIKVPCPKEVSSDMCTSPCGKLLDCGHECTNLCNENCVVDCNIPMLKALDCGHEVMLPCYQKIDLTYNCKEDVKIPLICGHVMIVTCFKLSQLDTQNVECKQTCNFLLPCGHYCSGACTSCIYGSDHVSCNHTCDRTLICGHMCEETCHEGMCAPCPKMCENWCPHKNCNHPCSAPCPPCFEKCVWNCRHFQCALPCSEPCTRPPCTSPCNKKLPCGHQCIGACGEPCPKLCRRCDRRNQIFKKRYGHEEDKNSIFILLEDCGHILEMKGFKTQLNSKARDGSVTLPECTYCHKCIRNNVHLGATIKPILKGINSIKCYIIEEFKLSCIKNCKLIQDAIQELPPSLYLQTIEDWLIEIDKKVETFGELKLPYLHSLISLFSRVFSHPPTLYEIADQPQIHYTFLNDNSIQLFLANNEFHLRSDQMQIANLSTYVDKCKVLALFHQFRGDTRHKLETSDFTLLESHFQLFAGHLQKPLSRGNDIRQHLITSKLFFYKLEMNYGSDAENEREFVLSRPAHCHRDGWYFCPKGHPFATKDKASHCLKCNDTFD